MDTRQHGKRTALCYRRGDFGQGEETSSREQIGAIAVNPADLSMIKSSFSVFVLVRLMADLKSGGSRVRDSKSCDVGRLGSQSSESLHETLRSPCKSPGYDLHVKIQFVSKFDDILLCLHHLWQWHRLQWDNVAVTDLGCICRYGNERRLGSHPSPSLIEPNSRWWRS
ncbi:hypothetical protein TIFTF001_016568 [Ficus carica]|uniref:Uncharacterized protein n=1 Tax=Ficus carica TaxID=3494 RepID=A0AA88A3E0_FICCA|nr:hypothetical protein TIFTF001_016568 [Ficus carica]